MALYILIGFVYGTLTSVALILLMMNRNAVAILQRLREDREEIEHCFGLDAPLPGV